MRQRRIALIVAALALGLAGCGGDDEPPGGGGGGGDQPTQTQDEGNGGTDY